ncbi:hypothetical protein T01_15353 [Trichinella spiralis]|uniref:Uncharacterized protein n=1 Tax=Trichinella spiralis TaxID=6334 RepID=A0A0V1B1G0_TRISP|nr:hypothetical protein T01_15353 [Trichinella spiralis]
MITCDVHFVIDFANRYEPFFNRGFKSCNPPSQLGKLPIRCQFYSITNEHRVFDIQDVVILFWDLGVVLEFESHADLN